jgi:hypothetical protein
MSLVISHQHKVNRETLDSYRLRARACVWAGGLGLTTAAILALTDPFPSAGPIAILTFYAAGGAMFYSWFNLRRIDPITPFRCACEGYDDIEDNGIWRNWVCGFCGETNDTGSPVSPWSISLLDACKHCGEHQHSVLCWRCSAPIIWDESAYNRAPDNTAWYVGYPALPGVKPRKRRSPLKP